jgi:hypothetical protein
MARDYQLGFLSKRALDYMTVIHINSQHIFLTSALTNVMKRRTAA